MATPLPYFTIFSLIAFASVAVSVDTGCSFNNGQCVYNVQLGHASQCDSTVKRDVASLPASFNVTGFQSCSCKDIDDVNGNVNSLWSNIQTLQSNFDQLARHLNLTQDQLSMKVVDVESLQKSNTQLSALLTDREYLLNKSQVVLADTVTDMNAEMERLRIELTDTNNKLTVCRTNLGLVDGQQSKAPVLYGNFVTHICDFETIHMCNYTVNTASSAAEKWNRGTGRQNTVSGPVQDHTFGAPNGHYMFINPYAHPSYRSSSSHSTPARVATMTSPEFPPANNYCIRFWYTMYGADIGFVKVYAQVGGGNGYPIFTHSGQIDKYWQMVEVPLDSEYTAFPFKLVFEGSTDSYYEYTHGSSSKHVQDGYGYIAIDDVFVYNTTCKAIPECPVGSRKMTHNNQTSCYSFHLSPMSWYDAVKSCKMESPSGHLVSVNTKFEHDFLVDTIANDIAYTTAGASGWYTSGNDEERENHFVWTASGFPTDLNFTNWRAGQPNNVGDIQNCLLLQYADTRYEWGDVNCADKHPYICEIPL